MDWKLQWLEIVKRKRCEQDRSVPTRFRKGCGHGFGLLCGQCVRSQTGWNKGRLIFGTFLLYHDRIRKIKPYILVDSQFYPFIAFFSLIMYFLTL